MDEAYRLFVHIPFFLRPYPYLLTSSADNCDSHCHAPDANQNDGVRSRHHRAECSQAPWQLVSDHPLIDRGRHVVECRREFLVFLHTYTHSNNPFSQDPFKWPRISTYLRKSLRNHQRFRLSSMPVLTFSMPPFSNESMQEPI